MARIKLSRGVGAVVGLALTLGCDEAAPDRAAAPGPVPGTLVASLHAAPTALGGLVVELDGIGITNLRAAGTGSEVFVLDGNVSRVAILGEVLEGALVAFDVPDVADPGAYSVRVIEAADVGNALLSSRTSVTLRVERPGVARPEGTVGPVEVADRP